jgi:hypothetical protein
MEQILIVVQHEAHSHTHVPLACDELWVIQENGDIREQLTGSFLCVLTIGYRCFSAQNLPRSAR